MPSVQRGQVIKRHGSWHARYYDESHKRRERGGFPTKTVAVEWLSRALDDVEAQRRGETFVPARDRPQTIDDLLDLFLERHGRTVDANTKTKLTQQLKHARSTFGDRHPDSLHKIELEDWRETLPAGSRPDVFRACRQALSWAVERDLAQQNPTTGVRNAKRKRHERSAIHPFEGWDDVRAIADELDARYRAIPIVGVGCGLRPEELFGLHRADVDRQAGLLHVRRRFTCGELKDGGKTEGSVRAVPLRAIVVEALEAMPARIDTPVLFPAPRGGYIDIERFRHREWTPALRAAGIEHRPVKAMRHTFATWAIESGKIELSYLARIMGTSVRELEDTYFRWLTRTDEQLRAAFNAYDSREEAAS
jgi:integrase